MGSIQVTDDLYREIETQVSVGRAPSAAEFVRDAVLRYIDDARAEQDEIEAVVRAGDADLQTGAFVTIATADDERALRERTMAHMREQLAQGS